MTEATCTRCGKRLVPEDFLQTCVITLDQKDSVVGMALLESRRKLEIALYAVEYIYQYKRRSDHSNALEGMDAITMRGAAGMALDAIKKEGNQ